MSLKILMSIVVISYIIVLGISLSLSSVILLLVSMECLSWFFTMLLYKNIVIKYLMIQSIFFLLMVVGLLWSKPLMMVGMMIKMGLPPFHLWFLNLSQFLKKNTFLFFTTLHKMIPLFFVMKSLHFNFMSLVGLIMGFSVIFMMETGSLYFVMIFSSMSHSGWMMISSFLSYTLLFFYWVTYSFLMLLFFSSLMMENLLYMDSEQNSLVSILWLIVCGLPPFTMFWLKVSILTLFFMKSLLFSLLLMMVPILTLVMYYRIFHLSVLMSKMMPNLSLFIPVCLGVGFF